MAAFNLLRQLLRDALGEASLAAGLTEPRRLAGARLSVLTFHRVLPAEQAALYPFPGLSVTPEELDWVVSWASRHYFCGPLDVVHESWRNRQEQDRPSMAITFDDGSLDNYVHALPVLARHGIRATFFVPAGWIGQDALLWYDRLGFAVLRACASHGLAETARRLDAEIGGGDPRGLAKRATALAKALSPGDREDFVQRAESLTGRDGGDAAAPDWAVPMGWGQLSEVVAAGHEVGSHSWSHPMLPQCDPSTLVREVAGSRRHLESRLGVPITSFCYPDGAWDQPVEEAVRAAGYSRAVTTSYGSNRREAAPFRLKRFDMVAEHLRRRDGRLSHGRLSWRLAGLSRGGR